MRLEVRYIDDKGRERQKLHPWGSLARSTPAGLEVSVRGKTTLYEKPIRHRWRHEECKHPRELRQMGEDTLCPICGLLVEE